MRAIILVLLVVFSSSVADAQPLRKKRKSGFDKVLRSMFQPRKIVTKSKPIVKVRVIRVERKRSIPRTFTVDAQWMARYWELEMAWDYWIQEDEQIKFKDSKYIVPVVVFKHYEDMVNTARRPSAANADPISSFE